MLAILLSVLTLLAACGPDVSVSKVATDADNDGYDETVDCNDAAQSVHPEAPELCDGVDQDCDGVIDEDATDAVAVYTDADGDGYGDADTETAACAAADGQAVEAGDCDDADAARNPGAAEVCNDIDDDCDGAVDDDPADALVGYADSDGDGHGDAGAAISACTLPDGYVADADDCDDTAGDVYPGAPEPDCTDPVDHDCDGVTAWADDDGDGWAACQDCDDADRAVNPDAVEVCDDLDNDCDAVVDGEAAVDAATWYRDADTDGWGDDDVTRIDCDEPAGYVAAGGDCDDLDAARNPGETEICDAMDLDEDCSGNADDDDAGVDAATFSTFARDADTDTYGDPGRTVTRCDAPAGYVTDATDCDDTDADISPADVEVCNGVDDDCDTRVDDDDTVTGTSTWYADTDGDSYGGTSTTDACDAPAGYVAVGGDCDDTTGDVSPAADEVCNGLDDDCDALVDDDDADVSDPATWYRDADGDAWGRSSLSTDACVAPAGYVAFVGDCDDADALRNPGETEVCDAANLDEDCSGTADDADGGTDASTFSTFARDADTDTYGDPARTVTQCDMPAGYVVDQTDCDDTNAGAHPGAVEVDGDGVDQDCDGVDPALYSGWSSSTIPLASADHIVRGVRVEDSVGFALATPDLDGDGLEDIVAGMRNADFAGTNDGGAYIFYGGGHSGEESLTDADEVLSAEASGDAGGTYVAELGDVDGDGQDDVFVSAHWNDAVASNAGRAYVISGAEVSAMGDLGDAWAVLNGQSAGDIFGYYLNAAGDLDGDGLTDLLVGASFRDEGGTNAGKAYVFLADSLGAGGSFSANAADYSILGDTAADYLGEDCAPAGDIDHDGVDDFVVGGTQVDDSGITNTGPGHVYLFLGASLGSTAALDASDADTILTGNGNGDAFGQAIGHGDFDGDARSDLSITACYNDDAGSDAGANYLFLGSDLAGAASIRTSDAALVITGDAAGDMLGVRSTVAFDVDLDGMDDLFTGAVYSDLAASDAGVAALYLSSTLLGASVLRVADADFRFYGEAAADRAGAALATGDVDGDTVPDLVVGAHKNDGAASDAGAVYVMITP